MPRVFAFLRAINAGPGRVVKMNALRQAFESLGFSGLATFFGSGNVVFETRTKVVRTLEKKIKRRLRQDLGYNVPVFIRTPVEMKRMAALEPFEKSEIRGADVNIILLADNLAERAKEKLALLETRTDGFHVRGREIRDLHFLIADHSLPMSSARYSLRERPASSIISVGPESGTCDEFTETPQSLLRHS